MPVNRNVIYDINDVTEIFEIRLRTTDTVFSHSHSSQHEAQKGQVHGDLENSLTTPCDRALYPETATFKSHACVM